MNDKHDQRVRLTIRQMEVFAAAGQVARSQSAASNALSELEITLGVQVFDRVGRRLVLNENGRALLPHAASIVEQAIETEAMFAGDHAAALRLASSYTIGEYLLPELIAALAVIASPDHPFAKRRPSIAQLGHALWILREPGSGTREAVDSWLISHLDRVQVDLELGSNEAVKRSVASGLGLGCLSRHTVADAVREGWLVEVKTSLPEFRRTLAIVVHRTKRLGSVSQDFLRHCMRSTEP